LRRAYLALMMNSRAATARGNDSRQHGLINSQFWVRPTESTAFLQMRATRPTAFSMCYQELGARPSLDIRSTPDVLYNLPARTSLADRITLFTSPQGKSLCQFLAFSRLTWLTGKPWANFTSLSTFRHAPAA
jgi:hypothetical protein